MTAFSHGERRYLVLVNRGAGTVRSRGAGVVAKLVEEGLAGAKSLEVRLLDGAEILPAIREALEQDRADVIVVGGGDGTLSSAAGVMAGRPQTLAVLPLGTMNMVSQAAGFSRQLEVALREVAAGTARAVDVGRVNGRAFLHQVSFGIQPRVVRIREKIGYTSRATKILSGMVALFSVLSRPRPVRMVGGIDGQIVRLKLPALVVSNNLYRVDRPSIPVRLDGGVLGVYMITATRWRDYIWLMLVALRGAWKDDEIVNAVEAREVRLAPRRGKGGLLASIDGELTHLKAPVGITIEPRALNLITGPGLPVAGVSRHHDEAGAGPRGPCRGLFPDSDSQKLHRIAEVLLGSGMVARLMFGLALGIKLLNLGPGGVVRRCRGHGGVDLLHHRRALMRQRRSGEQGDESSGENIRLHGVFPSGSSQLANPDALAAGCISSTPERAGFFTPA